MKARRLTPWLLMASLISLAPRIGWAFGEGDDAAKDARREQQEKGATRLYDVARKLERTCVQNVPTQWHGVEEVLTPRSKRHLVEALIREMGKALPKEEGESRRADVARKLKASTALTSLDELGSASSAEPGKRPGEAKREPSVEELEEAMALATELGLLEGEELKGLKDSSKTFSKTDLGSLCTDYCGMRGSTPKIDICKLHDDLHLARVAYSVDPVSVEKVLDAIEKKVALPSRAGRDKSTRGGKAWEMFVPGPLGALTTAEGATELAIRLATALGKLAIDRAKQEAVIWALGELGSRVCGTSGLDTTTTRELRTYWLPQLCSLTAENNLQSGFGAGQAMFSALVSAVENDAKGLPGAAAGLLVGHAYWAEDVDGKAPGSALACTESTVPSEECERFKAVRLKTARAIGELLQGSDPVDEARAWSTAIDETNRIPLEKGSTRYVLAAPLAQLTACGVAVAAELGADDSRRTVLDPEAGAIPELHRVIGALTSAPACWTLTGNGYASAADFLCKDDAGKDVVCNEQTLALDRAGGSDVERISTVIRLGESLKATQTKVGDAWHKLAQVTSRLRDARARLSKAVEKAKGTREADAAVVAAIAKLADSKLEPEDLRALLDEAKLDEAKDRLSSALDVAEELLAATEALAVLLEDVAQPSKLATQLPGLCAGRDAASGGCVLPAWADELEKSTAKLHEQVAAFRTKLADVQSLIDALRDVLAGDWAAGSTKALAAIQALFPRSTGTLVRGKLSEAAVKDVDDVIALLEKGKPGTTELIASIKTLRDRRPSTPAIRRRERIELEEHGYDIRQAIAYLEAEASKASSEAQEATYRKHISTLEDLDRRTTTRTVVTELGELVGIITAILSAKDSDDMAVVLEKTASPPGSWRRKQAPGAFTLSLGSHVGMYAAAEFRWGQYGVNRERGTLHGQAPTLTVPIGFDFAWGTGRSSLGFFVPLIDPAAFVQYDVGEKGRLPGPRPLTVLSPGAFFRWGICRTPLTLLLGYTYRPRLRTWEATINEPGADAHQIGLSVAIDATFWNIVKR